MTNSCTNLAQITLCVMVVHILFSLLLQNSVVLTFAGLGGHRQASSSSMLLAVADDKDAAKVQQERLETQLKELEKTLVDSNQQNVVRLGQKMDQVHDSLAEAIAAATAAARNNQDKVQTAKTTEKTTTTTPTTAIFVLGAGHSGTSIAAGLLTVSGATMPLTDNVKDQRKNTAAERTHPAGIFESTPVTRLNEEIMNVMGITMTGPPSQYRNTVVNPHDHPDLLAKVRQTLVDAQQQVGPDPNGSKTTLLFKDPRFSYTMPFWSAAADTLPDDNLDTIMVVSHRHPVPTCHHNTCPNCGGHDCFERVRAILRATRRNCVNGNLIIFDLSRFQANAVGTYHAYLESFRKIKNANVLLTEATTEQVEQLTAKRQDEIPPDFQLGSVFFGNSHVTQELLDELKVYETIASTGCTDQLCGPSVVL